MPFQEPLLQGSGGITTDLVRTLRPPQIQALCAALRTSEVAVARAGQRSSLLRAFESRQGDDALEIPIIDEEILIPTTFDNPLSSIPPQPFLHTEIRYIPQIIVQRLQREFDETGGALQVRIDDREWARLSFARKTGRSDIDTHSQEVHQELLTLLEQAGASQELRSALKTQPE